MTAPRHPPGLITLFFTEMWERLSYYGMRALLVLFMVDQVSSGGMGLSDKTATAIYGLYTAGVYLAALPGGWMADRLLGYQRAVAWGGILIAIGHFVLGVPGEITFFLGLVLVVLGTGLLKPNISAMVGQLYPEGGARRDAGFTIFYMGINLGGLIGPLICSTLGEKFNWHWGFTAAGVGMSLGLVQFYATRHLLGEAGRNIPQDSRTAGRDWTLVGLALAGVIACFALAALGRIQIDPVWLAGKTAWLIVGVAIVYFAWALLLAKLEAKERGRVVVIGMLFVASAMFWAGFEQAGSSLNLFADRYTNRTLWPLAYEMPAGWFQSINSVFIIALAPLAALLWVALGRRGIAPSLTTKMAAGLLFLALGFVVVGGGARVALSTGRPVWPTWLIATYLIHTLGELCLSPVGLSAVTKLAPSKLVGQMMGIWFLATSLGNLIAGLFAGEASGENVAAMPQRFFQLAVLAGALGVGLLLLARRLKKLSGGVE